MEASIEKIKKTKVDTGDLIVLETALEEKYLAIEIFEDF